MQILKSNSVIQRSFGKKLPSSFFSIDLKNTQKVRFSNQSGFSLIELMLVIVILGMLASTGMMLTGNMEDQNKYDETLRRRVMIKQAIVGDTTRTINGAPELGGFVADMGRVPNCISELYEAKSCDSTPVDLPTWAIDSNTGLGRGWRGPYLEAAYELLDNKYHFRDGYGCDWIFTRSTSDVVIENIKVQSQGADCLANSESGASVSDFPPDNSHINPADNPATLVFEDDYLTTDTLNIIFMNQTSATSSVTIDPANWEVKLGTSAVFFSQLGTSEVAFDNLNFNGNTSTSAVLLPNESIAAVAEFDKKLPMGLYSLNVTCKAGHTCPGVTSVSKPYPLTLLPRHQIPTLKWIVEP